MGLQHTVRDQNMACLTNDNLSFRPYNASVGRAGLGTAVAANIADHLGLLIKVKDCSSMLYYLAYLHTIK